MKSFQSLCRGSSRLSVSRGFSTGIIRQNAAKNLGPVDNSSASASSNDSAKTTHFGFRTVAEEDKEKLVKHVFSNVAENYDYMNDAMSLASTDCGRITLLLSWILVRDPAVSLFRFSMLPVVLVTLPSESWIMLPVFMAILRV